MTGEERQALAEELERQIRPLIHKDRSHEGGYDCCGCDTYEMILDHAIAIVLGERDEDVDGVDALMAHLAAEPADDEGA